MTEGRDLVALKAMYATVATSREVVEPALKRLNMTLPPDSVLKRIKFDSSGERLFELQVTDATSSGAAGLANALADSFVERSHALYAQRSRKVVDLLTDQLRDADAKLHVARAKQDAYGAAHHFVGTLPEALKAAQLELEDAKQRRDTVREELAASQARLKDKDDLARQLASEPFARSQEAGDANSSAASGELGTLRDDLARTEKELADLRANHYDTDKRVIAALAARNEAKTRLAQSQSHSPHVVFVPRVSAAYETARHDASELRQEISGMNGQIAALDGNAARSQAQAENLKAQEGAWSALAADITARTEARANLATRLNAAKQAVDVADRQNPIMVMERADSFNPPKNVSTSQTKKFLLLGGLGAFVLTAGLILAFDSQDRRVKTLKEAELVFPTRVLAAIPQPLGDVTYAGLARATELAPQSLHSEQYRFLGLHLLNAEEKVRSLMVLAAKAEQGSTTTITNLGITLAQAGQRVVLVDANMRTAELHQVFDLPNKAGFTDLLRKPTRETLDSILRPTTVPNLSVITTGMGAKNPWELFRSDSLQDASNCLHEIADFVLYDTPPAVMFTDAFNLAPVVDAAILCVRALEQPTGAERRLVDLIEEANVRVLGSVLNDVPASVVEGYDNYQHYYVPAMREAEKVRDGYQAGGNGHGSHKTPPIRTHAIVGSREPQPSEIVREAEVVSPSE